MIDFKLLNELLPASEVARLLGLRRAYILGSHWRGKCPFHVSSSVASRSFKIDTVLRKFYCHKCQVNGDLIELYAKVRGVRNYQAAQELSRHFRLAPERE